MINIKTIFLFIVIMYFVFYNTVTYEGYITGKSLREVVRGRLGKTDEEGLDLQNELVQFGQQGDVQFERPLAHKTNAEPAWRGFQGRPLSKLNAQSTWRGFPRDRQGGGQQLGVEIGKFGRQGGVPPPGRRSVKKVYRKSHNRKITSRGKGLRKVTGNKI